MLRRFVLIPVAAALLAVAVHVPALAADLPNLPEPVSRMLEAAHIPSDAAGIVVLRGDATLVSHNAGLAMQPASTMKLFTTLVALEQLGPTFRGRTEFRSGAEVVNGVLQGDLILRGGADADFNEDVLTHMLQALRNQDIKKIKGNVVLDRQLFQPARPDVGVAQFDEFPWAYYNVIPDALLINTNLLKLELRSTAGKLSVVMMPEMEKVNVRADMTLNDTPCATWEKNWHAPDVVRKGDKIDVVLHGSFPKDCVKSTSVNVLDRHDYLERLLRATWRRLGGSLSGDVREAEAPLAVTTPMAADGATSAPPVALRTTRLLAEHVSRPLPEVMRDTNKMSDNTLARTIFLSLGSLEGDAMLGSHPLASDAGRAAIATTTAARAEATIRTWLQNHRIDATGLVIDNGSGLSRTERATPAQLAGVLQVGMKSLWMPEFLSSLPIAATDGTMRKRLKDSPAAQRARVKTGSLSGVIAIAGVVRDANDQPCIVVAMLNDEHVANGAGRAVLDALIDWVARSGGAVQP